MITAWAVFFCLFVTVDVRLFLKDTPVPNFGMEMRLDQFTFEENAIYLNGGSKGATPKPVQEAYKKHFDEIHSNPEARKEALESKRILAEYLNVDDDEIVYIENVSNGINAVLRSIVCDQNLGDAITHGILYLSFEYSMTRNVIRFVSERCNANLFLVDLEMPMTSLEIFNRVKQKIEEFPGEITIAVFDHITSTPCLAVPIKQLTEFCHEKEIRVVIDAAHAFGQVQNIDLSDLGVDYYALSLYKWQFGTQGNGLLYVKRELQEQIYPAVVSTYYGQSFQSRFAWQGTRIMADLISMRDSLDFREWVDQDQDLVHEYNSNLCRQAGELFKNYWKTESPFEDDMQIMMYTVEIPCDVVPTPKNQSSQAKKRSQNKIRVDENFDTEISIVDPSDEMNLPNSCYSWNTGTVLNELRELKIYAKIHQFGDRRYFRLSCQIYNEFEDYVILLNEFEKLIAD